MEMQKNRGDNESIGINLFHGEAVAYPNIAFVKYWGKDYERQALRGAKNLPNNDTVSMSLEGLETFTSVDFGLFENNEIYIDGQLSDIANPKTAALIEVSNELKKMAGLDDRFKVHINSKNNFPSSAGIASSAAGAAAFVLAASAALGLNLDKKQQSILAREISGSGARSVVGGFVVWHKGQKDDGSDSYAEQIAPNTHWPELVDIIVVVSSNKKKVSSGEGHELAVKSPLYSVRPRLADENCNAAVEAIKDKNFELLGEIIIKDWLNMHAIALDTGVHYLTDESWEVVEKLKELNVKTGKIVAAYTFDAGPNPHIITLDSYKDNILSALKGLKIEKIFLAHASGDPRIIIPTK
ncbi:MAG: diphosphomevalonate decarboxylase [Candidatus Micrarchaeia archaeon]